MNIKYTSQLQKRCRTKYNAQIRKVIDSKILSYCYYITTLPNEQVGKILNVSKKTITNYRARLEELRA